MCALDQVLRRVHSIHYRSIVLIWRRMLRDWRIFHELLLSDTVKLGLEMFIFDHRISRLDCLLISLFYPLFGQILSMLHFIVQWADLGTVICVILGRLPFYMSTRRSFIALRHSVRAIFLHQRLRMLPLYSLFLTYIHTTVVRRAKVDLGIHIIGRS